MWVSFKSPYGGCVYPNAKAFGYGEHVSLKPKRVIARFIQYPV
jgi:hypothetical protein